MRLVLAVLLLSIGIGALAGGRVSGLSSLRIRLAGLAVAGLLMQFLSPSRGNWPYLLLMGSFALLTVFAAVNIATPGFPLILAGMLMNFLVIGMNHGMPVTAQSLSASGQQSTLNDLINHGGEKHHLATTHDRLLLLGDVIAIPPPVAQTLSAGDAVSYAGVGFVVVSAMRRRRSDGGLAGVPVEGAAGG